MMASTLEHLTITTGHTRRSPKSEVSQATIVSIKQWLRKGSVLGDTGWSVRFVDDEGTFADSWVFDLLYRDKRIVACWLCGSVLDDAIMWSFVEKISRFGKTLQKPRLVPWLAVAIVIDPDDVRHLARQMPDIMMEAGDLERCMAWALLD